ISKASRCSPGECRDECAAVAGVCVTMGAHRRGTVGTVRRLGGANGEAGPPVAAVAGSPRAPVVPAGPAGTGPRNQVRKGLATMGVLDRVQDPADLRGLSDVELTELAEEIRGFLVEQVSATGGHLGPNLGVV